MSTHGQGITLGPPRPDGAPVPSDPSRGNGQPCEVCWMRGGKRWTIRGWRCDYCPDIPGQLPPAAALLAEATIRQPSPRRRRTGLSERDQLILALHAEGLGATAIARHDKVLLSRTRVADIIAKHRTDPRRTTDADAAQDPAGDRPDLPDDGGPDGTEDTEDLAELDGGEALDELDDKAGVL